MDEGAHDLAQLVHDELARAAPGAALRLAEEIRERVGPAVAASPGALTPRSTRAAISGSSTPLRGTTCDGHFAA